MKFIFPQNYRYHGKILGLLDYVTATIDLIVGVILFFVLKVFVAKITIRHLYFYANICSDNIAFYICYRWRKYSGVFLKNSSFYEKKRGIFL